MMWRDRQQILLRKWQKMKTLLRLLLLLSLSVSSGWATTVPITGTLRGPSGARFTGSVRFRLPIAGALDTSCTPNPCVLAPVVVSFPVNSGNFPSYAALTPNTLISPANTVYSEELYDQFSSLVAIYYISVPNVSPFDIGTATPTSILSTNVSFLNPASLSANNTFTGNNTFSSNTSFSGNATFTGGMTIFSASGLQVTAVGGTSNIFGTLNIPAVLNVSGLSTFSALSIFATPPQFPAGVDSTGAGFKVVSGALGCTTAAAAGATCTSPAQTWPGTAWADINYRITCSISSPSGVPVVSSVQKTSVTQFKVTIAAMTAVAAGGTFECIGIR